MSMGQSNLQLEVASEPSLGEKSDFGRKTLPLSLQE